MKSIGFGKIIRESFVSWIKDDASSMGAAIAFYTLFAIAPILLFVIWIAGRFFAADAVQAHVLTQVQMVLGDTGEAAVRTILVSTKSAVAQGYSRALSAIALLFGATSVFAALQNSLDRIWQTALPEGHDGLWHVLRNRLLSFGLVLCVGFLLLVSLLISASLEALSSWLDRVMSDWNTVIFMMDVILGFVITTVLFALIYKFLPRERVAWGDVWVGAVVTATLFTVGKFVILVYFGRVAVASAYGAAGSFLVLLLWVYYSAQIFLLGAEFTRSYAYANGSRTGRPEAKRITN
ncbi:MAG: YihY/virulence factor BrkB family protein [Gammaproteobacteria bacterium]